MTNALRRIVTASVLSALVLSAAAPANASFKQGKRFVPARVHHAKLPVHHVLGASVAPSTPTNFVATAGDQQAAFSWTQASGATRYVVMLQPNNASCVTVATSCAVRGLVNGTLYSATVVAVNSAGRSAPSATRTVTPAAVRPTAPRSVNAVAFGLHARVTWLPVTGLSNSVTSYTATSTPGGLTCTSATTTCVVSDLEAGTSYTFTVTATNAVGTSPDSQPSPSIAIVDRPDAPTSVTLAPSPDSMGVSWEAPVSDGGLSIDSYTATAYLASSGAPVAHCRTFSGTSCEITGLAVATSYVVRVIAHNALGYSIASTTAGPVLTGYNPPGQPLNVTVVGAPESLTVDWLAPSSDGGGEITGYTATADDGNGGLFTCTTTELTCTISGLTDGVTYAVTVVATNGVGDSVASESLAGTPGTVADAPTDLVVTPGNGEVTVSWAAPLFDGGFGITGYTATADDGNGGLFTCTTTELSCTIDGLTNGTTYTVSVIATNSTGDSLSSASAPVTPITNPSVPAISTVAPGDGTLEVTFEAPASDGGSSVTGYTVTADDGFGGLFTCTTSELSCTITGLTNGTSYTITVVATNGAGDSLGSASVDATPYTVAGAPVDVVTTSGDGLISVSWTSPENTGGDAIFRYTATADDGDGGVFTCSTDTTSCTIEGLTNGTNYTITVVATNNAGDSAPSTSIADVPAPLTSVPDSPTGVSALPGGSSLLVSWTAPAYDGGLPITGYTATADDGNGGVFTCTSTFELACVIDGLTDGVVYSVTVVATNEDGDSSASVGTTGMPFTTATAPSDVTLGVADGVLVISWSAPSQNGGSDVISYKVWIDGAIYCETVELSCSIAGLLGGMDYLVVVTATNAAGDSLDSQSLSLRDGEVARALSSAQYSAAEITGVLKTTYGLSSTDAALVLRYYLGIDPSGAVNWLDQGGYTLTAITIALHYAFGESVNSVWNDLRNWFPLSSVEITTLLHAADYNLGEIVYWLHFYIGNDATTTAQALGVSYKLTDVEMVTALNTGLYDPSDIVRALCYVYEDSSDAVAAALQTALDWDAYSITQAIWGSGCYNETEVTSTLRNYFELSATDAGTILRFAIGVSASTATYWLTSGGYTLAEAAIALHYAYGDSAIAAWYDLQNSFTITGVEMVALLHAADFSAVDIAYLFHYYVGDDATATASALNLTFDMTDVEMATTLNAAWFDGASIVRALYYVYEDSADAVAAALQTALGWDQYAFTLAIWGSGYYTFGELTSTLRNYFELSATDAGTTLRYGLGVNIYAAVNWLSSGGYSLTEITIALHDAYGGGVADVWYALRTWFPVTDVEIVALLHAADYAVVDIAYLLYYYVGDDATAAASALNLTFDMTDVEMATTLNAVWFDGASIVRALYYVYEDSADAVAAALQTALGWGTYSIQPIWASGCYSIGEVASTLRNYFELSATDAGSTLRFGLGLNIYDAVYWLYYGGYTLGEIATALHDAYGENVAGVWYALRNWFPMPESTITPLLYEAGFSATDAGYLLHYYFGDSATQTATWLKLSYDLTDIDMTSTLDSVGYDAGGIARMLFEAYGDSPSAAAYALETALGYSAGSIAASLAQSNTYTQGDVTGVLRTYFELSATDAATILRYNIGINADWAPSWLYPGGYTLGEIATALHYAYFASVYGAWSSLRNWFDLSDSDIAPPLYAADYTLVEIASLLHDIYGDSAAMAATVLNELTPMGDVDMATVLNEAGYEIYNIARMLFEVYGDDSSATAYVLQTAFDLDVATVTGALQQSDVYSAGAIASALRLYFELSAVDAATVIRQTIGINSDWIAVWLYPGGYTMSEVVSALHYSYDVDAYYAARGLRNWYSLTETEITAALSGGGYSAGAIAWVLHYLYGDSAITAAAALNVTFSLSDADMMAPLQAGGYNEVEVAMMLHYYFEDSALTALTLLISFYGFSQNDAVNVLHDAGYAASVPAEPANLAFTSYSGYLALTWDVTSFTGGFALDGYTVTADDGNGGVFTCTTTELFCTIDGLTNGTTYYISIVATNYLGNSQSSGTVTAVPYTTPDSPQDIKTSPGVNSVTVAWNAPETDGGSAITSYTVYAFESNGNLVGSCSVSGADFSCTITGLTNFTTYSFTVTATNAAGESASSVLPSLRNPQSIIEWGDGWLAYDNWDGFLSSDSWTQNQFSDANYGVTEGWDCNVKFMVAGPNGGVYTENDCGDMYFIDSYGNYEYIGWNTWGNGYQFAVGPNGELVFATDSNSLHVYDYNTSEWYVKYLDGADCINGVTIDRNGTIWISDLCRGDIAEVTDNIFDGVDGEWYSTSWKQLDLCSPYWLSSDSSGTIYIGNDWCGDNYSTYNPATGSSYVSTPGYYPLFVGGVFGQAAPIDFDYWPHRLFSSGVTAMPQSNEPSVPQEAYVYTVGGTWIRANWTASQYQGLGGSITAYRLMAVGPSGDLHFCVTNQQGITNQDAWAYTCVVSGLTPGVTYSVSVLATNNAGDSPAVDLGTTSTYDPIVTVPELKGTAQNYQSTTVAELSVDGSNISVSNLPPNYMVTVWVTNASLSLTQGRQTGYYLQGSYWGGGNTSVMSFVGESYSINNDLAHLTITPNVANQSVTIYAIATPRNIIYNPVNGHYYASTLWTNHSSDFAGNLSYASQQNFLGMQGYMATPLTSSELTFLNGFVTDSTFYGGSDDPAFIIDSATGLPRYQYLYANNDSNTASTSGYQDDPNASFQRWYWVSGPHAGEQFATGGQLLYASGGNAAMASGVNGYQLLFCPYEPNAAGLTETVMIIAGGCQNDISPNSWQSTMVEFGGMSGDVVTGTSQVTASATFTTFVPLPHAPTSLEVSGDEIAGFNVTWTAPNNMDTVWLSVYEVIVYRINEDGSETRVWSNWINRYSTQANIGGMSFPNSYRVVVVPNGSYGNGDEGSTTFTAPNVRPVGTLNAIAVTGNSVSMNYSVTSTYGAWWVNLLFYDADQNYLGSCGSNGTGTFQCDKQNLPTFATISYDLQVFDPYTGWTSAMSGTFVTGDVDRPNDATAVTFTPDYWSGTVNWTLPETNTARYWRVEAWTTDNNGEPYLASAQENWDPNATSMTLYSLNSDHQYKFILYAITSSSVYSLGVNFAGTSLDPYPAISKANVTVLGNAVVGLWNVSEVYGGVYGTRMEIYATDGTYIATCGDYSGVGDGKTCWIGGLALATDYYAIIQGYGWSTNWGGGVRLEFTTAAEYVPSNYYNATNADGYIYSAASTPDGSFWYYSSTGVHHVVDGVDTFVDVSAYLPEHVGLSQMTGLASNGVAFSTNGYDNGWLDTGILYIDSEGGISYLAAGATNCASTIVPFGDHWVVISNFYGLTAVDLNTGDYGPLPGLSTYDQMYARIIPSNNGVLYFLDRYDSLLLHRYDGSADGSPIYTDVALSDYVGDSAVIVDDVLYYFTSSAWYIYNFTTTNLVTGVTTSGLNFHGVIEIPRLVGVTASGDLLGAASYTYWTVAAQHSTLPLG